MKFEELSPNGQPQQIGPTNVIRGTGLETCGLCGSFTKWRDERLQQAVCSLECLSALWNKAASDDPAIVQEQNYAIFENEIKNEIEISLKHPKVYKDILIVVHNQFDYVKKCLDSVQRYTENYRLFIWDNASDPQTADYLKGLEDVYLYGSSENLGFIKPNNNLFEKGKSPYVILLNSDTEVFEGWADAMTGYLQEYPKVGAIGYLGGILGADAVGQGVGFGSQIDYVCGWCLCVRRRDVTGLFDQDNLSFAYGEDSDFCLRLKEKGLDMYALHVPLVHHFGNKTVMEVLKTRDLSSSFERNHEYLRRRWKSYLENDRVELRRV